MGEEERACLVVLTDGLEGVKVLRNQHELHDFLRRRAFDGLLELLHRGLEALDDGLALVGDALPLESLALGFGFGLLDDEDLLGFAAGVGGHLLALRGIDIVHGDLTLESGTMSVTSTLTIS